MKHFLLSSLLLICFLQNSQSQSFDNSQLVGRIWSHLTGNPGDTLNWTSQVVDGSRNLITIGNNLQSNQTTDMLLTKYNGSDGSIIWQVQYDNNAYDDFGIAVVVDASRNIYTASTSYINSTNGYDWVIQKYDSNGTAQWTKTFNSGVYDVPTDMKLDGSGHLYVTGVRTASTTLQDYCTIKYDVSNGNELWSSPAYYDYTNLIDIPAAITFSVAGRVIVAGGSGSSLTNWDFATVKYNQNTGAQISVTRNASSGLGFDQVTGVAKDSYDNIYITGRAAVTGNSYDVKIVKLDTALNTLWSVTKDGGAHLNDAGNAIGVDASGYVYVTGYTTKTNGGTDYFTLKYNSSGTLQWSKNHTASDPTKSAIAKKLDIDPYGNVLITGDAYNIGNRDILTLAYDVNGNQKWEDWIGGLGNGDDYASGIKIDDASDYFYVTGKTWSGTAYQYTTTKYIMVDYITPPDTEYCPNSFAFYENNGQIIDDTGGVRNDLPFYSQSDFPNLYFSNTKTSFQFFKPGNDSTIADSIFRVEMKYQSGLASKVYAASPTVPGYLNYFAPQCSTGVINIKGHQYVLMKDIYKNTDALYYGNSAGMKMCFNCYPGSSPTSIVMNFVGATSVAIVSGTLKIITPLGTETFIAPEAFQINTSGVKVSVGFTPAYTSAGTNKISFTLGTYNTSLPLILEMKKGTGVRSTDDCGGNCTWSSFYEGGNTVFENVRTGADGKIYVVGDNRDGGFASQSGIQLFNGGASDAVALKFNDNGTLMWATYLGGSDDEAGRSIDVDAYGNVFFTGYTTSDDFHDIVVDPGGGAFSQTNIGSSGTPDAFIAKLNATGNIPLWITYYGGSGSEVGYDLRIDNGGHVYVVGAGDSNTPIWNNISATYNQVSGYGFIAEFSILGLPYWATNFGSSNAHATVTSIDADLDGNIYVVGFASNDGLPTSGSYSNLTYRGGSFDGFAAAFNTSEGVIWCTYIGGSAYDQARDCAIIDDTTDDPKYLLVTGPANSTQSSFLPLNNGVGGYYDNTHAGTQNAFVTQFEGGSGQSTWSTFYGASDIDLGQSITVDIDKRVYVTGFTEASGLDLPTVDHDKFYYDSSNNSTDAFILCFDKDRALIWASYFGGESQDLGNGIAVYQDQKLYLVGETKSVTSFPLDDGLGIPYYHPTGNANSEGFITRFDLDISFTGIENLYSNDVGINIYPNPSNGNFNLSISLPQNKKYHLSLFDAYGRIVEDFGEYYSGQINLATFNASQLSKGLYFLKITGDENNYVSKIVIE